MTKVLSRFLVFLLAVLAVVTVALTLFYFLRSEEVFSFSQGKDDNLIRYVNTGETLDVTVYRSNASANTYTLVSSDDTIIKFKEKVSDNIFRFEAAAAKGGSAEIKLQTSNTKYADLSLTVRVGNGTKAYPYFVRNYTDFANVGKTDKFTLDSNYLQVADIDMRVATEAWTPIGDSSHYFEGTYNGNGHNINNFAMIEEDSATGGNEDVSAKSFAALFAAVGKDGVVSRINLNKVTIDGSFDVAAAVACSSKGAIQFITVKELSINNAKADSISAGIVGEAVAGVFDKEYASRVMYCGVNGVITSSKGTSIGGIVGVNGANSLVMNNYANVSIDSSAASACVGGIVGCNVASSDFAASTYAKASVVNNYAVTLMVVNIESQFGAIIGENKNVDGSSKVVLNPTTDTEKKNNRIYGNYYQAVDVGNLMGIGGIQDSTAEYITTALTTAQMKRVATAADLERLNAEGATIDRSLGYVTYDGQGKYTTWNFDKTWEMKAEQNGGLPFIRSSAIAQNEVIFNGTSSGSDPVEPVDPDDPKPPVDPDDPKPTPGDDMTQAEFRALFETDLAKNNGKEYNASYVISRDVILTEAWVPIGTPEQPFNGKFVMTNGATIHNLFIEDCGLEYYGLFGYVGTEAYVNGVSIEGVKIILDDENEENVTVGTMIGYCEARGVNDVMYSTITALNKKSYITASANDGFDGITVTNKKNAVVGGVIGQLGTEKFAYDLHCSINITVNNCSESVVVGGVIGLNQGYTETCSFDGVIDDAGVYKFVINATANKGAAIKIGGVAGENTFTVASSSFAGKLLTETAENVLAGGIVGMSSGLIERCAARSVQINGGAYVGGLVGVFEINELLVAQGSPSDFAGVYESYASGALTGKKVGGLAGTVKRGTISNCYTTASLSGEAMAGFVVDLPRKSDTNCGKVKYCYSAATFDTNAGSAYWESASVIRQTNGWWAGNSKLAGCVENCIYNTHDNDAEQSKKIDSIKRQYSYYILNKGYDCDDGRNSDENCKKVSTFTSRGSGFNIRIWNLVDGSYPTLLNVK